MPGTAISTMQAKGSAVRTTIGFIRTFAGEEALQQVLDLLPTHVRNAVIETSPADEITFELLLSLWRAADEVLTPEHPDWVERSGAYSIESGGVQHYGGILRKTSPLEFLNQPVSLFRLYYHPGNMEVVEQEADQAVLRLVGFPGTHPLFCRRQTGGLQRALELAGGGSAVVEHVRCAAEGDAFCEWSLRWNG